MRIPWFRSRGRTRGTAAITLIPRGARPVIPPAVTGTLEYWRMCEHCCTAQAVLFCRTHTRFYCADCAWSHDRNQECSWLSYEAARALAKVALCELR